MLSPMLSSTRPAVVNFFNETLQSQEEEMHSHTVRQVCLITYSQADEARFPTRESFVQAVLFSFYNTPAKVVQWCCCLERHTVTGIHYHMAVKLNKNQRWLQSKKLLLEKFGISVHFSRFTRTTTVHGNMLQRKIQRLSRALVIQI